MSDDNKVLVVDDEPLIARSIARMARMSDLEPTIARDGLEAWAQFEQRSISWLMLITDIRMPRLDGLSLARRVREAGNKLPIVFISGHSKPPDMEILSPAVFLAKPFRRAALIEALGTFKAQAQSMRMDRA